MREVDLVLYCDTLVTCRGKGKPKTGREMDDAGVIKNAGVACVGGKIIKIGSSDEIKKGFRPKNSGLEINAGSFPVLPGLVDSHTHPVFAGNRIEEFMMRARGATYQEISKAGGGIQFTVNHTRKAGFDELYRRAENLINKMICHGTTTVEAKSGYGLETKEEIRELQVIKKLSENMPVDIVPTFLGTHAIPSEYKENREEYIRILIEEMMPLVKKEGLAKFADIFCEEGEFTKEESRRILDAAKKMGFGLKIHAEEFTNQGGAVMAADLGAVSADHLLRISDEDIKKLAGGKTILTLMPSTLFFLDSKEFAPARKIIDNGAYMSLATDYNAGSCMSLSMQMAMSLACIKMKMSPNEAINAATYNASFAVGMENEVGSIEEGKKADMIIFDVDDYRLIPFEFGENLARTVIKNGFVIAGKV